VWLTAAFSLFLPITLSNELTSPNFDLFCPDLSVTAFLRDSKFIYADTPAINIATRFADFRDSNQGHIFTVTLFLSETNFISSDLEDIILIQELLQNKKACKDP